MKLQYSTLFWQLSQVIVLFSMLKTKLPGSRDFGWLIDIGGVRLLMPVRIVLFVHRSLFSHRMSIKHFVRCRVSICCSPYLPFNYWVTSGEPNRTESIVSLFRPFFSSNHVTYPFVDWNLVWLAEKGNWVVSSLHSATKNRGSSNLFGRKYNL